MAKIIKIDEEVILVGNEDGGITEVRKEDLNFEPSIGDVVDIYSTDNKMVVVKKEIETKPEKETSDNTNAMPQGAININVQNAQGIPVPPPVQQPVYQPYAQPNTRVVNKLAYCLFALFLGGLGVHKFYAGKTGLGIVYLLFFWTYIPAIISLVEFVIAVCKPADAYGNITV